VVLSKSEEEEPIIECKIYGNSGILWKQNKDSYEQTIDIEIEGKTVRTQVLMAEHVPNLIGRDVLCALDAKITMTPRGLALQCPVKEEKTENQTVRSVAYWVTAEEIMKKARNK